MDLKEIRNEIDQIDDQISRLFEQRMTAVARVAMYKKQNGISVLNEGREKDILKRVAGEETPINVYKKELFIKLFELSRNYQLNILKKEVDI